jgi:tripartite-type tricarboxylate transporter receptor subunit TctC
MNLRKCVMALMLLAGFIFFSSIGQALDFPRKPIVVIVPYMAGGTTDLATRALAEAAKKHFGQPVIVENRPGGGSAVGVGSIVGKEPDGYLVSVAVEGLHRTSYMNKLSFDTVKDVTPIMQFCGYIFGIWVRADSPFKTLKDLIDYAKANPGKISYMASGIGGGGHIATEELAYYAGIKFTLVPSKGDAEATTALLGGHIDVGACTSGLVPLLRAGKVRLLAIYTEKRAEMLPDVPTVTECGYKVAHNNPITVLGPKGMPKNIVKALHDGFRKAIDEPSFRATLEKYEMPVMYKNTEDCAKDWAEAYVRAGEQVRKYMKKE